MFLQSTTETVRLSETVKTATAAMLPFTAAMLRQSAMEKERQSAAAIVILPVGDTSMTTAITKAQEVITSHANFKSIETKNGEAWWNFKFSMPNDAERDVFMAIQFFDYSIKS